MAIWGPILLRASTIKSGASARGSKIDPPPAPHLIWPPQSRRKTTLAGVVFLFCVPACTKLSRSLNFEREGERENSGALFLSVLGSKQTKSVGCLLGVRLFVCLCVCVPAHRLNDIAISSGRRNCLVKRHGK